MAEVVKFRCPCCGSSRTGKHFGLTDDGEFDPEEKPQHVLERIVFDLGGRGSAQVTDRGDLGLDQARALRASLQASLDQLNAEISAAEGDDDEDLPEENYG